ncbi:MAG: aldose 1-epimerase family protein [Pontiella sp.]
MITIENKNFSVKIALQGAELRSFKKKATGREMMWQADPSIWGGSAPILFPVVGALCNGKTKINGQEYEIPKHGLVRHREAELIEQHKDRVVFAFRSNANSLKQYPYPFLLEVEFRLGTDQLAVSYRVKNPGAGEMLFSIGSHPAFALDLNTHTIDDYYLEFEEPETLALQGLEGGLFTPKRNEYMVNETRIPLTQHLFDDDALIFTHIRSRCIRLKSTHESEFLEIDLGGAPHLGLWAKPGAAYVCIEPWYSHDDAADSDGVFENKPGIIRLPANQRFETGYTIRVEG